MDQPCSHVLKLCTKYHICICRGSESTFPGYSVPADSDDAKSWTQREATKDKRDCCGKVKLKDIKRNKQMDKEKDLG